MGDRETNVCEEKVFQEIFNNLSKDLYRFLYYKYGADNNPEDLVQEAFAKLWNNCDRVPPEKAKAFLFTVASNQVINEIDKKKTVLNYKLNTKTTDRTNESPEYLLEENEYMQKLKKALESLSDAQRVALLMNRVEGKRHKEIADLLGISRKAVEKRIYAAVSILKDKLGDNHFK